MGYQFLHYDGYGMTVSKKAVSIAGGKGKAGGRRQAKSLLTVRDICAEAMREDGAHPHVEAPAPPRLLAGVPLPQVEAEVAQIAAASKDSAGRKLRKDAQVMLAGVVSFPTPRAEANPATVQAWERRTVDWLRERWGDRLRCVLAHDDEAHPHLHFYVTAAPTPEGRYSLESVCPARAAQAAAKRAGADLGEQRAAFGGAMAAMQDDYHAAVASDFGLLRTGPRRERLSRAEYRERQRAAEQIAEQRAEARMAVERAQREAGDVLTIARSRASQVVQDANQRAGGVLADARDQAAEVRAEAEADAAKARQEAARMAEEARGLLTDLRSALDAVSGRLRAVGAGLLDKVVSDGKAAALFGLPGLDAWRQRYDRLLQADRAAEAPPPGPPPEPPSGPRPG